MKQLISDIADQFYDKIVVNQYFSSFFVDKNFEHIKTKVVDYLYKQMSVEKNEVDKTMSYRLGMFHAKQGIPLNNIIDFMDHIQHRVYDYCSNYSENGCDLHPSNIEVMRNYFAKGYLHDTINSTDMMSIPLFSVFSTTRVSTTIISWMRTIQNALLAEKTPSDLLTHSKYCDLNMYIDKPFFHLIFENDNNIFEFNRMHMELHNTANSLLFFLDDGNYVQTHFVYNDFVEQCKSILNFYFERVVLFEQNNENYFYRFAQKKISLDNKISVFTFNLRNMQIINKIWGTENGDYLVSEVERLIDKEHGMHSGNSIFIKTKNAEFYVMLLDTEEEQAVNIFLETLNRLITSIPRRGEFHSDLKISSAFIPLLDCRSMEYSANLKEIVQQAVTTSKNNNNKPVIYTDETISNINNEVLKQGELRKFIRHSFNRDNFRPYFHTIINAKDESVSHVEVLARVCDDETCISAGAFIDYLIQTERIIELDKVMLEKIKANIEVIKEKFGKVFINISPRSLSSPSYLQKLREFIQYAGKKELDVVFEITEQSLFDNLETVKILHATYKTIFAIDDFGAGYSNFSIVSDLAHEGLIKYLKIDGSLIQNIHNNIYKENIVAGIISIAQKLELQTVAEFVSDKEIAEKVKSLDVDFIQGFVYSVPRPLSEF